ncbi:hypothetical protein AAG906_038995 [Vitis piasezkii]
MEKEYVILLAAGASRIENQDSIDAVIVRMIADPKEAQAGIKEDHSSTFNLVDKVGYCHCMVVLQ